MFVKKTLTQKTILVCPLNWGLGHASRMVPVIHEFLVQGCIVHVAASGAPMEFTRSRFGGDLTYHDYPGRKITYPKGKAFFIKFIFELPSLLYSIFREHKYLKKIVKNVHPELIISDNRYGAWHPGITSVFVTHQLYIRLPGKIRFLSPLARWLNHCFIGRFDLCWVPDYEYPPGLSGALSHGKSMKSIRFIGPVSRFEFYRKSSPDQNIRTIPTNFILVMLSGPEPQRTILEKSLQGQLKTFHVVFFRGLPGSHGFKKDGNFILYDDPSDDLIVECLEKCEMVICRSGYSSIMDISVFGKKVIFIPTPGQTEQEYLAEMYEKLNCAINLSQNNIKLLKGAISRAKDTTGLPIKKNEGLLKEAISGILSELDSTH